MAAPARIASQQAAEGLQRASQRPVSDAAPSPNPAEPTPAATQGDLLTFPSGRRSVGVVPKSPTIAAAPPSAPAPPAVQCRPSSPPDRQERTEPALKPTDRQIPRLISSP